MDPKVVEPTQTPQGEKHSNGPLPSPFEKSDFEVPESSERPVDVETLILIHGIEKRRKQVEADLLTDPLTLVPGRRYYDKIIEKEVGRVKRTEEPLSFIMIDIDFFKKVNDTHGHSAGDGVLRHVAQTIQKNIRTNFDTVARYGGEELVVILPDADLATALKIAEKLRVAIEKAIFKTKSETPIPVTISCGVAELGQKIDPQDPSKKIADVETIQGAADAALYAAKHSGRNKVCVYEIEMRMQTEEEKIIKEIEILNVDLSKSDNKLRIKTRIYQKLSEDKEDKEAADLIRQEVSDLKDNINGIMQDIENKTKRRNEIQVETATRKSKEHQPPTSITT